MAVRRATTRREHGGWRRRLRRLGAGLLGTLVCVAYAGGGWLGVGVLVLGAVDVGLVWFLVRIERAGGRCDRERLVRPQVVAPPGPSTPVRSAGRHAAFAGALVEVAARYRDECEREAAAEALAETRGLGTGVVR
jgi:hypothetical protein